MAWQITFNPEAIGEPVEFEGYIRHKVDMTKAFKWVQVPEPDKDETATDERRRPLSE